MNELALMVWVFMAGLFLGTLYFGGLWFSVKKGLTSDKPAIWFIGSFLIRMAITLSGFYYVSQGNWQRLLVCLLGFISARYVVMLFTRKKENGHFNRQKSNMHANKMHQVFQPGTNIISTDEQPVQVKKGAGHEI